MKIQYVSAEPVSAKKNQVIENKSVNQFTCRLSKRERQEGKMKVYPGMLLKIKDRFSTILAAAGMLMKNKNLTLPCGNIDERKGD
jgi:hypothetical protein